MCRKETQGSGCHEMIYSYSLQFASSSRSIRSTSADTFGNLTWNADESL